MKIKHSNKKLDSKLKERSISFGNYDTEEIVDCLHIHDVNLNKNEFDNLEKKPVDDSKTKKILPEKIENKIHFPNNDYVINDNKKTKNLQAERKKSNYDDGKEVLSTPFGVSDSLLITDLDEFFKNIYDYYYNKGFNNILTQTILDNISYLFCIHFLVVNIFLIDWREIIIKCKYNNSCSSEISEFFNKDKIIDNLMMNKFYFSIFYSLLIIYYFIFLYKSVVLLKKMKFIKKIYNQKLKIKQSKLENIKFDMILTRLISLQRIEGFCRLKENITKFDIISRIMRQENYLIALFSNGIIDTKINFSLNFKIPFFQKQIYKKRIVIDLFSNFFYTKLNEAVINFAFGTKNNSLNKDFINLKSLRLKLFIFMLMEIIFIIPFVFLKIIFWLFKNADNIKSDKKTVFLNRNWDKKMQILFKNYNELQHYFDYRIINSNNYLRSFDNCFKYKEKLFNMFKKFLKLIFGSILFLIFMISFFDSRLLTDLTILGKNFVWIGIGVGIVLSLTEERDGNENKDNQYLTIMETQTNNYLGNSINTFDNDNSQYFYKKLLNSLINVPKEWPQNFEYLSKINKKINNYNGLTIIYIIREIFAILFFPIVWIKLIIQAEKIRQFILQNSVDIDGLGTICSFSFFNYQHYKKQREKKDIFIEFNFNDRKFFNSSFYFRNIFYSTYNSKRVVYRDKPLDKMTKHSKDESIEVNNADDLNEMRQMTYEMEDLNQKFNSSNDNFYEMAESEKENEIYIEDIKLLEKKIFEFYRKKTTSSFYEEKSKNINLGLKSSVEEICFSKISYEDKLNVLNEGDENNYYLSKSTEEQEGQDYPFCKKDIEDNFFFYSNKIHLLNEFDLDEEDNPFKAKDNKYRNNELKMNDSDNKKNVTVLGIKQNSKVKDKISDFILDKNDRDLNHFQQD